MSMQSNRWTRYSCARVKQTRAAHCAKPGAGCQTVDRGGHRPGGGDRGGGLPPLARTYHMGALRSGLAIGEVQALLNPHVGSGERGVSPGSPRVVDRGGNRLGGGGSARRYPGKTLPGHDELLVRTGRALTDCPPTRITTVFRGGGGRLTADRPIVPESDVRLLNWTVSSQVSLPNVRAYGARPLPP